jgi:hypothetical protein
MEVGDEVGGGFGENNSKRRQQDTRVLFGACSSPGRVSDLTLGTALNRERSTRSWIYQRNRKSIKAQSSVLFWKHLSGVKF